jgi:hypothetical protein
MRSAKVIRESTTRSGAEPSPSLRPSHIRSLRLAALASSAVRPRSRWPIGSAIAAVAILALLFVLRPMSPTGHGAGAIGGLRVLSVSEAIDSRDGGALKDSEVAVAGYWTDRSSAHGCAAASAGELELYCVDGQFGITELNEPIFAVDPKGDVVEAKGPHLTPWLAPGTEGVDELFTLPIVNGQRFPPVPITVVGHFDDKRAVDCRPESVALCADRLVVSRIVEFLWQSVATPRPSQPPTPFPSPAPAELFNPKSSPLCAGDVPYSFVGWTTTEELKLAFHRDGHVWAAITADTVPLGGNDWTVDAETGRSFRVWGREICLATEAEPDVMLYGSVPGTTYREYEDGTTVPVDAP